MMKLSNTQLFRGIEEKDIQPMLQCLGVKEQTYKKGETILSEGDTTEWLGIVLSGMALIEYSDVWGSNSVLGHVSPGAVFGETYACIPGEALLINVTAAEDTAVLFINVGKALGTCTNACAFHTKLIRNLLSVCASKSLQLSQRILHTTSKSIRGRLLSYFSDCIKKSGSYSFDLPYNRQQLADYLGIDRSTMCNELSKMQREGLLRYTKNHFVLQEPGYQATASYRTDTAGTAGPAKAEV